jgi:hypothetical protein
MGGLEGLQIISGRIKLMRPAIRACKTLHELDQVAARIRQDFREMHKWLWSKEERSICPVCSDSGQVVFKPCGHEPQHQLLEVTCTPTKRA